MSMKRDVLLSILILVVAFAVRLYHINAPIADWHSFRQVDTASVAQIFAKEGIDLLHPRYHDLSNIQSGKDNPQGWRMVEFPLYQATAVLISKLWQGVSLDVWLRLTNIFAQVGSVYLLILLGRALSVGSIGYLSALVFAVLPYNVFYGRTILPESFAVFWSLLSLVLVARTVGRKRLEGVFLIMAAVCGAIAILVKPTAGFLLLPVPYLLLRRFGWGRRLVLWHLVYGLVVLAPFLWWRSWILQYPEGIAAFEWLLNKDNIRLKGAWFHWLFARRIAELVLGFWGLVLFGLGVAAVRLKKEGWFVHMWGVGMLSYFVIFAGGNVQHDYYQIIAIPIICWYVAYGIDFLVKETKFARVSRYGLLLVCALFGLAFSWFTIRTYYWINRPEIILAGSAADRLLPPDAKVIAPYNGDTTFLYQTKRSGWPLGFDIDKKIAQGATHYVTISPTDSDFETKELAEKYTVVVRNDSYAIIDLTKPRIPSP